MSAKPGVLERLPVQPAVAVGLHSGPRLARDHDDGARQPVGQRGPDLMRVGRIENSQWYAERAGDHLRRQRGAAHPRQHHVVEVSALLAQGRQSGQQRAAAQERVHPAEPVLRLGLGRLAPQRRVLLDQQAGHPAATSVSRAASAPSTAPAPRTARPAAASTSAIAHRPAPSWVSTLFNISSALASNFSTPSRSSVAITSS